MTIAAAPAPDSRALYLRLLRQVLPY